MIFANFYVANLVALKFGLDIKIAKDKRILKIPNFFDLRRIAAELFSKM